MLNSLAGSEAMRDAVALLGRLLMAAVFVKFGFGKAVAATATVAYFTKLGLPAPDLAFVVTVLVELVFGSCLAVGFGSRTAALVLAFWCIATALVGHSDFSNRDMLIQFFKKVAMCGGLLHAFLLGPGRFSVDHLVAARTGITIDART